MVFESILGAKDVEGHPTLMFVAGFSYTFASVFLALFLHPPTSSVLAIALSALAALPLMLRVVEFETHILELFPRSLPSRQMRIIMLYGFLFLGQIAGYVLAYTILPPQYFLAATEVQRTEISIVRGMASTPSTFWVILANNLRVYVIGILLSFVYGSGGVFLLSWNASILAALLTEEMRKSGVIRGLSYALGILPHGVLEFSAYFVGGFLGGFISMAILQEGWNRDLLLDTIILFLLGIGLIVLGAWVEAGFML